MRRNQQISELERLLARERMILEQLRIHLEGLLPETRAYQHAAQRIVEGITKVRALEHRLRGREDFRILH
jgi:uncharacterized coiled-coil protein SlyX